MKRHSIEHFALALMPLVLVAIVTLCFSLAGAARSDVSSASASSVATPMRVAEVVSALHRVDARVVERGSFDQRVFHWPDASFIAIHFSEFSLAPNDWVEVSDPNKSYSARYEGSGKSIGEHVEPLSTFWAKHVPGDTAVVSLHRHSNAGGGYTIDQWSHGYPTERLNSLFAADSLVGPEAICGADDKEWAACYAGDSMYDKARAVARLLINGQGGCTGWLLGSEGHLMTNNHCIRSEREANNTDYEFMAEGATCDTSCAGFLACPGVVEADSGSLVATDVPLDFSLIKLPASLTERYGYLQLRNAVPSIGEQIFIPQHALGWGKQLAVTDSQSGGFCRISSTTEPPCAGGSADIGYNCDTDGGSSGSPVLASDDGLVIALHHCADCPNRGVPAPDIIAALGPNLPPNAIDEGDCDRDDDGDSDLRDYVLAYQACVRQGDGACVRVFLQIARRCRAQL